jgi:small subunit ribosomal protein S17
MADEEKKNQDEEKKDEAPAEEAPKEDAPKEEEPKAEEAPKEDAPTEEQADETAEEAGDDAPADAPSETPDTPAGEAEDVAGDAGDDEELSWKTKRRLERSRQPAETRPQQSPEERAKQAAEQRRANAVERGRYRKNKRAKREKGTGTEPADHDSVDRKVRRGTVVSDKADKTITVRIDVARRHPTYEKIVRRSSTIHAHDERNEAGSGDLVQVVETRPMSRTKRWRLTEIIEKAK